jgi:hypothetical protein
MEVPNETIMANAIADRLSTDRFASIRDVFISVHLFEPKFPVGWFSFSISCCLKVAKRRTDDAPNANDNFCFDRVVKYVRAGKKT